MTAILFKNAKLVDPEAGTILSGGLVVRDGKITEVLTQSTDLTEEKLTAVNFDQVIDCERKHLAPGIVDIGVKVCERRRAGPRPWSPVPTQIR